MAFCFTGSLLRANFSIVSLFFLFDTVIVRGKYIFFFFLLLFYGLQLTRSNLGPWLNLSADFTVLTSQRVWLLTQMDTIVVFYLLFMCVLVGTTLSADNNNNNNKNNNNNNTSSCQLCQSGKKDLNFRGWEGRREGAFLFQRVSVLVQRYNAVLLHDTLSAPLYPIVYFLNS